MEDDDLARDFENADPTTSQQKQSRYLQDVKSKSNNHPTSSSNAGRMKVTMKSAIPRPEQLDDE
jgi:hypothetical protein